MTKEINFDMDGTIANFYGVDGWLEYLLNGDATPYREAKPLMNFSVLARTLNKLQKNGYRICIISWLAKVDNDTFHKEVEQAKREWLMKHLPSVQWDKITIVPYGTPKSTCGDGILFDDEEPNRREWAGTAYGVNNILEVLKELCNR